MEHKTNSYYLPAPSQWPLKASLGLLCMLVGLVNWLHGSWYGPILFFIGFGYLSYVIYGWFRVVVLEDRHGLLANEQVNRSFKWGMCWFIFSEVMFFGAFFSALFYVRLFVIPSLGEATSLNHILLWPHFSATWPLLKNPSPSAFIGPSSVMAAWGIPTINTLILLTSGATITVAHYCLLKNYHRIMIAAQTVTILLGMAFLILQAKEYGEAYFTKGLTLASGIYGSTFFMLTGFHGLHVTIGTIGLCVILYRMLTRDFDAHHHFAFQGVSWYWHFVDVVWLFLFVFVYWI
jgi:cytochrome c oxidase subunit 3